MAVITAIFLAATLMTLLSRTPFAAGGLCGTVSLAQLMVPLNTITASFFTPTALPDATSYIAWADVLPLLDPTLCLFGPFRFSDPTANPPGRTPSFRQFLAAPLWASLTTSCLSRGISPPIIACPLPFAPDGLALLHPVPTLLDRRLPLLPDCCLPADRCPTDAPLSSAADLC
jgi:hypothetical protein